LAHPSRQVHTRNVRHRRIRRRTGRRESRPANGGSNRPSRA
jgi:hypothetical protein